MASKLPLKSSSKATKQSKASRKSGKPSRFLEAARAASVFLASTYLAWILFFPAASGIIGRELSLDLVGFFGASAYLLPAALYYGFYLTVRGQGAALFSLFAVLALSSAALLFAHIGDWSSSAWLGGTLGRALEGFLTRWLGSAGSLLFAVAFAVFCAQAFVEIPWAAWFNKAWEALKADYLDWQNSRAGLETAAAQVADKKPAREIKEPVAAKPAPLPPPPAPEPAKIFINGAQPENKSRRETAAEEQEKAKAAKAPAKPTDGQWKLPSLDLLEPPVHSVRLSQEEIAENMLRLEQTLANFGIAVKASGASAGPIITQYELTPAPGVKVSSITARSNDIALAMKATSVRIIAPIPGKAAVGIEIPNSQSAKVVLREILEASAFKHHKKPLGFSLGRTVDGTPTVAEITGMPHLLVAGATNSGKSVLVHSLILSILFRSRPDEVKFFLIDPKRLELTFYEGIPHLYDPRVPASEVQVLTQPKEAAKSLAKLVEVMSDRYEKYKTWAVRDIEGFNAKATEMGMPRDYYIVVVIDELADLILVAQKAVEDNIQRLAQMARAVGIHLILATQRPSVDVITGVIKANLPARIALAVRSIIDSRVILDTQGAESLVGRGDMLYLASGAPDPVRIQGAYVSEAEINKVADFWRSQGKPSYQVLIKHELAEGEEGKGSLKDKDLVAALKLVQERRRVSQDLLKAHFGSSARATDLLSTLEVKGFIMKPEGTNRWEIFYDKIDEFIKVAGTGA